MPSKYFKLIAPFVDQFGVIAQSNGDGGDGLEREGLLILSEKLHLKLGKITSEEFEASQKRYRNVLKTLEVSAGNFRRHPDQSRWYGMPDRMSRDQLTSNIVGMGFADKKMLLRTFLGHLFKRALLFTTNTRDNGVMPGDPGYRWKLPDLTLGSILAAYIRGFDIRLLLPLSYLMLTILDLGLVMNSLIINLKVKRDPNFSDHLSHLCLLYQAKAVTSTLTSKLAAKVYMDGPLCETSVMAFTPIHASMMNYFDPSTGAAPFDQVFRDLLP